MALRHGGEVFVDYLDAGNGGTKGSRLPFRHATGVGP
jgi:hypothetical protein